jgi:arylsulfatase A-like enzyme
MLELVAMIRRAILVGVTLVTLGTTAFFYLRNNPKYLPDNIEKPHILLIMIDTLRADHLGIYGYSRNTSPNIDALARRGILFKNAYSVSSWTNPTIASLFTGHFPQAIFPPAVHKEAILQSLPEELNTLAELLKSNGYKTIALMDHPGITPELKYDQGFDVFVKLFEKGNFGRWDRTEPNFVLNEFSQQLDAAKGSRMFLYLHLVYPHLPYWPAAPYDKMFGEGFRTRGQLPLKKERQGNVNMYDGEIRQTDDMIGKIMDELRRRHLNDETYVLITSDHGEAFWEHKRYGHGNSFFDEVIRIALVMGVPEQKETIPLAIDTPVSNIDLFPTILHLASVPSSTDIPGKSLLRYVTSTRNQPEADFIFSESSHTRDIHAAACLKKNIKYIHEPSVRDIHHHLYDLSADPKETRNLATNGDGYMEMRKRLMAHLQETQQRRARFQMRMVQPDEDTKERLRALGYVD